MKATVIIPTHNHSHTLKYSLKSVLSQTLQDFEVFIIGDGVDDDTRQLVNDFINTDSRICFFDHPKGPRHGEIYRHEALKKANGDFVAYLSDDDLWLPNHLENLENILMNANLGNVLPLVIDQKNQVRILNIDLTLPFYKNLLLSGENRIPLSAMGHTLELYRQLPFGWRTTPHSIPTDLYMWQQFLSHSACRPGSIMQPTICCFPSPQRLHWTNEKRGEELKTWQQNINDPEWWGNLSKTLFADSLHAWNRQETILFEKLCSIEWKLGSSLLQLPGMRFIIKHLAKVVSYRPYLDKKGL